MPRGRENSRRRIFRPNHFEPGDFCLNYILLPYGIFYEQTKVFLDAKKGDILRFYNGPDYEIDCAYLIPQDKTCDVLCRMRYGIPWNKAFKKWQSYAFLEGHGRDILSREHCILVVLGTKLEGGAK